MKEIPPQEGPGSTPGAVGAVLAGGGGTRLGGGKPASELGGRALISYPIEALARAGLEVIVVAKQSSPLPPVEARVVGEPDLPRHPLAGIVAALRASGGRPVVILGCDVPFAAPALLARLATAVEPLVVPAPGGRTEPLHARYSPSLLPALEDALAREEPLRRTVGDLGPVLIGDEELCSYGEPGRIFFNVNDPTDLAWAERALGHEPAEEVGDRADAGSADGLGRGGIP